MSKDICALTEYSLLKVLAVFQIALKELFKGTVLGRFISKVFFKPLFNIDPLSGRSAT